MNKLNRTRRRRRRGFTLMELLLVMAILVILAGLVTASYVGIQSSSKRRAATTQIALFEEALDIYHLDIGSYPTTAQGLLALVERPADLANPNKWQNPYLKKQVPLDPWDNPYQYELLTTESFRVWSYGPDKTDNTGDEIDNLTPTQ